MTQPAIKTESSAPAEKESSAPKPDKSGSGGGLAFAAMVIALAAVLAAGYALWQMQTLQTLPQQLKSDSGKATRLYSELEERLDGLASEASANAAALTDLQTALAADVAAMAEVSMQTSALDQRVAAMSGSDAARRNRFLRAEALYYLRIANAQVLLARDASVGVSALELADDKLREAGDPDLTPVRAKLSEELAALKAVSAVDVAGISFKLLSLANQAASWPLSNPVPDSFSTDLPVPGPTEEGPWARLRDTAKGVFDSIVSIRQSDVAPEVQLSQAEQSLLVEGMRAELQLARLTLISGNMELYSQSLQRLQQDIPLYFDTAASSVRAALDTLAELAAVEPPGNLPDVSGSLQLLLAAERKAVQATTSLSNGAQP